jgi:hypothetical protein
MIAKHLLRPDRQRQVPPSFSWVDHRLIRHRLLNPCDHAAWALYLFLITVGDVQGLSYYSDAAIGRHLKMDLLQLAAARQQLSSISGHQAPHRKIGRNQVGVGYAGKGGRFLLVWATASTSIASHSGSRGSFFISGSRCHFLGTTLRLRLAVGEVMAFMQSL